MAMGYNDLHGRPPRRRCDQKSADQERQGRRLRFGRMLRTGWFWPVHVKSLDSHRLKTLPGARDQLAKAKRSLWEHFGTTGKNTIRTKQPDS
jgi:hypothetical protein